MCQIAFCKGTETLANWGDHPHTQGRQENAVTTETSLFLISLKECMPSALERDAAN